MTRYVSNIKCQQGQKSLVVWLPMLHNACLLSSSVVNRGSNNNYENDRACPPQVCLKKGDILSKIIHSLMYTFI